MFSLFHHEEKYIIASSDWYVSNYCFPEKKTLKVLSFLILRRTSGSRSFIKTLSNKLLRKL